MALKFKHQHEQYRTSAIVESLCNAITFVNKSDGFVYIEGFPLDVDETIAYEGWPGEMDESKYQLVFDTAVTTPIVHVIRKIYQ